MAEPPDYRRSESPADRTRADRVPHWLKGVIIILAIGALLFVAVRGGGHEIPSHSGDGTSTEIAAASGTVGGVHA